MMEIYENHAKEYDELILAEDFAKNLDALLHQIVNWDSAAIVESGVGTGRLPVFYASRVKHAWCCDRSAHMLATARAKMALHAAKFSFAQRDHFQLPKISEPADIFVEGWSFGHAIMENAANIPHVVDLLLENATRNLRPDGKIILIETLGTDKELPQVTRPELGEFYSLLENQFGFHRHEIRTDYLFPTNNEAARIMGFFFGPEMAASVRRRGTRQIPEWTGVWVR